VHRTNLPAQPTSLIGREQELRTLGDLLLRADVRLVTLTGPGGVGKTRLALQTAAELLEDFADGIFFVNLAPVGEPTLVAATIAQTLGVKETGGQPLIECLTASLQERHVLLLLDNFEQVAEAAPLLATLLAAAPRLKLLVTSRAVLHLYGEYEFVVPPLAVPAPRQLPPLEDLAHYPAVRLFLARAQAVKPKCTLTEENAPIIAAICHRLDGLPLAIELAAARIKLFSPQALLTRLEHRLTMLTGGARDLPARQQTLRAAIAWSHDLLAAPEQTLFRRLAVFGGQYTLEAAAAVCNADTDLPFDMLEGLAALVDQSLLRQVEQLDGEPRFTMLETIREYAMERLIASGAVDTIRRRHAEYYLALAERLEPEWRGPRKLAWRRQLDAEYGNLRAALDWLTGHDAVLLARLAGALFRFWQFHGSITEGRSWLDRALEHGIGLPALVRAKALAGGGWLAVIQGGYKRAQELFAESLALYRELGDTPGIADTLIASMWVAEGRGIAGPMALAEESLALCRTHNYTQGIADTLYEMACLSENHGDLVAARARLEESLELKRSLGDSGGVAAALCELGFLAKRQGDLARATALLEESLALSQAIEDLDGASDAIKGLGDVARLQGNAQRAATLLEAGLAWRRERGDQRGTAAILRNLGLVALAQGDGERARALVEESIRLWRNLDSQNSPDFHTSLVVGFEYLGYVADAAGRPERAARLWGAAETLREASGLIMDAFERDTHERALASARAALGEERFAAAWAAGRELPLEQAIADALAHDDRLVTGATASNRLNPDESTRLRLERRI
jgi:predicted ATPase